MKLEDLDRLDLAAISAEEIDFNMLINEDALLGLTYSEKTLYRLFAQSLSDRECAERTGLPLSTVSFHRAQFWERARSSLLFARLAAEIVKQGGMTRRRNKRYTKGEELPALSGFGAGDFVLGFERDKYALHKNRAKHMSVIVLVGLMHSGQLAFFVCDAASKFLTFGGDKAIYPNVWETPGGHCKLMDMPGAEIGRPLPAPAELIFENAAKRELQEELYIKGTQLDMGRLHYLCEDISDAAENQERSGIFLYRYDGKIEGLISGDVRFRDQWRTPLGMEAKKQWVAKIRRYDGENGLREEFMEHPGHFSDAMSRCLSIMQRDKGFADKIESLLRV